MAELKYEIVQHLATLAEGSKGWSKELNLVSWNDRDPKFDLREWAPDHTKMGKGITLTYDEMQKLCDAFLELSENEALPQEGSPAPQNTKKQAPAGSVPAGAFCGRAPVMHPAAPAPLGCAAGGCTWRCARRGRAPRF